MDLLAGSEVGQVRQVTLLVRTPAVEAPVSSLSHFLWVIIPPKTQQLLYLRTSRFGKPRKNPFSTEGLDSAEISSVRPHFLFRFIHIFLFVIHVCM